MQNWEYKELFEAIYEGYQEILEEGGGYRYAVAKLTDDFDRLGKIEDYIVDVAIGELELSQGRVFVGAIEYLTKRLNSFNPEEAKGELTEDEIKDLTKRMEAVLEGLKKVEVDYNPVAD